MSAKYLTNLMDWTGTSSGGPLAGAGIAAFGMPLAHVLQPSAHSTTPLDQAVATFTTTITHAGKEVSFLATDYGHASVARAIGCLLLWHTPLEGLEEALQSLAEIREHYASHRHATPPPAIKSTVGRAGETMSRAPLEFQPE